MLNINLSDLLKIYDSADDITKWIFRSYSDVVTKKNIKDSQVVNLVKKILENEKKKAEKRHQNHNLTNENNKATNIYSTAGETEKEIDILGGTNFFEKEDLEDIGRDKDSQFYKSKTNFFSSGSGSHNKEKPKENESYPHPKSKERYSNEYIRNEIEKANRNNKFSDSRNLFSDKFYDFDEV